MRRGSCNYVFLAGVVLSPLVLLLPSEQEEAPARPWGKESSPGLSQLTIPERGLDPYASLRVTTQDRGMHLALRRWVEPRRVVVGDSL